VKGSSKMEGAAADGKGGMEIYTLMTPDSLEQ